jgi:hypothetical protein
LFNEQDSKRRLGNFGSAGEHPRHGSRTSGIVGRSAARDGIQFRPLTARSTPGSPSNF